MSRQSSLTFAWALLGTLSISQAAAAEPLAESSFRPQPVSATRLALIGDVPYRDGDIFKLDEVIREINASRVDLTVHTGDIKSGSSLCADELLRVRFDQLQELKRPLVYTPGDNEWTDCHRPAAGAYQPLERLSALRKLFFPVPGRTLGKAPLRVRAQSADPKFAEFVENVLFVRSAVVFSTLHVVGSNNGLAPWAGVGETLDAPRADRIAEVEKRTQAALAWVDATFDEALKHGAAGVFLAMQANPAIEAVEGSAERSGFDAIIAKIAARTVAFGRPVLVAHGDSHYFRYDKPLRAPTATDGVQRVEDFARVENFGDFDVHWVEVIVDPRSPEVFKVEPHVVESNRFVR